MQTDPQAPGGFFYVLEDAVRIIYVDDDPIMREFASVHLATDHGDVATAGDGIEALEALERQSYDIMLLDLEMPRMDGFDVLARQRADERFKHMPIVVVTGREDVGAIDRAYQAGATSFLVKPINWRLLTYQIRYVHRGSRTEGFLAEAEAREHAEHERAMQSLHRLVQEGSELLTLAMQGEPQLRAAAARYAALLSASVSPAPNSSGGARSVEAA